jgi:hypothetical protein
MYTLLAVVALSSGVATANLSAPAWLDDYGTAQARVSAVGKPMAVFLGAGPEGWKRVVRDGGLDPAVTKLLAEKYVCVYVDTSTSYGRTLAGSFQVAGRGLVISDKGGTTQAFSLSGDLTRTELAWTLAKYAGPDVRVQATETVVREAPATVTARPLTYQTPVYAPQYAPQYVPQYRGVVPGYTTGGV